MGLTLGHDRLPGCRVDRHGLEYELKRALKARKSARPGFAGLCISSIGISAPGPVSIQGLDAMLVCVPVQGIPSTSASMPMLPG
jgi:hypothetical protein